MDGVLEGVNRVWVGLDGMCGVLIDCGLVWNGCEWSECGWDVSSYGLSARECGWGVGRVG